MADAADGYGVGLGAGDPAKEHGVPRVLGSPMSTTVTGARPAFANDWECWPRERDLGPTGEGRYEISRSPSAVQPELVITAACTRFPN